ncbi:MAG: TIGR03936 family radical SAM-associated protein [Candidatus Omnitrophica bacterium]|nr:TIGR03936 family radical SAM-associated protein [Candidatus Omnitrophota bacterium]MDD5429705.1 TIGR03936 family radical SAM-associated protein [Candidatus Omnitrophota bacterium]
MEKYALKVIFKKSGEMIYFSQLDLIHILERALRRSGLPLYFTQGFSPRVKISFYSGLKLGLEGDIQAQLYFRSQISFLEFKTCLSKELPAGLSLIGEMK